MNMPNKIYNLASGSGIGSIPGMFRIYEAFVRLTNGSIDIEIDDQKLRCPVLSNGQLLYYQPGYKDPATAFFNNWIDEGDTVVDAGAGIGYFTIQAAKRVGESGKVFAIEPTPDRYDALVENIRYNGWQNVTAERLALDSSSGEISMEAGESIASVEGGSQVNVPSIRLETLLEETPDLLKLDIEGAELSAIQGMGNLLTDQPDIICETHVRLLEELGHSATDLQRLILDQGYNIYEIWEPQAVFQRNKIALDRNRTYLFSSKPPNEFGSISVYTEADVNPNRRPG